MRNRFFMQRMILLLLPWNRGVEAPLDISHLTKPWNVRLRDSTSVVCRCIRTPAWFDIKSHSHTCSLQLSSVVFSCAIDELVEKERLCDERKGKFQNYEWIFSSIFCSTKIVYDFTTCQCIAYTKQNNTHQHSNHRKLSIAIELFINISIGFSKITRNFVEFKLNFFSSVFYALR